MKRKQEKPAYDRIAAGERLRCRRLELGWSRELVAERLVKRLSENPPFDEGHTKVV